MTRFIKYISTSAAMVVMAGAFTLLSPISSNAQQPTMGQGQNQGNNNYNMRRRMGQGMMGQNMRGRNQGGMGYGMHRRMGQNQGQGWNQNQGQNQGMGWNQNQGWGNSGQGQGWGQNQGQGWGMGGQGKSWGNSGQGRGMGRGMGRGQGQQRFMERFGSIDENSNDVIGADEAAAWRESVFAAMDADDDNELTVEEFMQIRMGGGEGRNPQRQKMRQEQKKARFAPMDTDKSGKVSKVEFMEAGKKAFAAADGNKDGKVTPWEFRGHRHSH